MAKIRRPNRILLILKILIRVMLVYFPGWIFLYPLSLLIPKKKNLVLFIGRDNGRFIDNVKYLFIHAIKNNERAQIFFITEEPRTYDLLARNKIPVIFHPTIKSFFYMLRANLLVVDNRLWMRKFKFYLLYRTKKVQLWHGVGFKKIETANPNFNRNLFYRIINMLRGRLPRYSLLVSTSEFYTENVFRNTVKAERIEEFGYPRNDILFRNPDGLDYIEADTEVITRVKKLKKEGFKVIIYTPTFRDFTESEPIKDGFINIEKLDDFSAKNRIVFVMKFHPEFKVLVNHEELPHILFYKTAKDIYPFLPLTDLLITDYSSIYMDYLLLDKPVVFFPYDFDEYITVDREIQFDYEWITPGPKCYTQEELQDVIKKTLFGGQDKWGNRRKEILNIAFKYKDGKASERIWNYIKEKLLG